MAAVTVARMRVAARPGAIGRARQRGEDALRLAGDDENRLLIVRRIALDAMPADASPALWQACTADALRMARLSAVHGGQPGAEGSGAVWFRSTEEARTLLMLLLARGVRPRGWYWRLAVPDWRGLDAAIWVPELLRAVEGEPQKLAAVARGLMAVVEAGHVEAVLAWIAGSVVSPFVIAAADQPAEVARAEALIARLPVLTRWHLAWIVRARLAGFSARADLLRIAMIAAAPELAAVPDEARRLARAWIAQSQQVQERRHNPPQPVPIHPTRPEAGATSAAVVCSDAIPDEAQRVPAESNAVASAPDRTDPLSRMEPLPENPSIDAVELRSRAAGVLLLIRPLWRMGLGDWLMARPDLFAEGFGRMLFAHIARRMRVAETDPIYAVLGADDHQVPFLSFPRRRESNWAVNASAKVDPRLRGDDNPLLIELEAWRIGLDRWLRRTARVRLCDVVATSGWLALNDGAIDVRFGVDQADIRLRRRALDLDPGWVDWLGLVVRYRFRDVP